MTVKGFLKIRDYDGEISTMTFNLPDITAVNWAGVTQDIDEIADEIAEGGMILGEVVEVGYTQVWQRSAAAVSNENAQRENKWLVGYTDICQYLDATANLVPNPGYGKSFTIEIATADLTEHLVAGTDLADMNNAEVAALVAVIEANVLSPYAWTKMHTGSATRVDYIKHVGRNV